MPIHPLKQSQYNRLQNANNRDLADKVNELAETVSSLLPKEKAGGEEKVDLIRKAKLETCLEAAEVVHEHVMRSRDLEIVKALSAAWKEIYSLAKKHD